MNQKNRVILIVLDSFGVGELPDASLYHDVGANTALHLLETGLSLPHLERLGLRSILFGDSQTPGEGILGAYGKSAEASCGKDTTVGHWEIAGLVSSEPFSVFPEGFPAEIMTPFHDKIGRTSLGNEVVSGTEILTKLGEQHLKTAQPIVYTSADSVFQIAAHEEIIPLPQLYEYCQIARDVLDQSDYRIARVIARPFVGEVGAFVRTKNRHDYSVAPSGETMLDSLHRHHIPTTGVGKISDIFAGRGLSRSVPTASNADGVDQTLQMMQEQDHGLIFTNLVDFDMIYGHRRDVAGYAEALAYFDARLPQLYEQMRPDDLLIITADHGCDPTHPGTDHTREYSPIMAYGQSVPAGKSLGVRTTFADISATVLTYLGFPQEINCGESFLP